MEGEAAGFFLIGVFFGVFVGGLGVALAVRRFSFTIMSGKDAEARALERARAREAMAEEKIAAVEEEWGVLASQRGRLRGERAAWVEAWQETHARGLKRIRAWTDSARILARLAGRFYYELRATRLALETYQRSRQRWAATAIELEAKLEATRKGTAGTVVKRRQERDRVERIAADEPGVASRRGQRRQSGGRRGADEG